MRQISEASRTAPGSALLSWLALPRLVGWLWGCRPFRGSGGRCVMESSLRVIFPFAPSPPPLPVPTTGTDELGPPWTAPPQGSQSRAPTCRRPGVGVGGGRIQEAASPSRFCHLPRSRAGASDRRRPRPGGLLAPCRPARIAPPGPAPPSVPAAAAAARLRRPRPGPGTFRAEAQLRRSWDFNMKSSARHAAVF